MHSSDTTQEPTTLLLAALKFAARKHSRQRRKDLEATPYINHPIEVAEVLSRIGGITELPTLQAAIFTTSSRTRKPRRRRLRIISGRRFAFLSKK
jgi:(p)ppGpp synthase/HD superfamily hydrolase